MYEGLVVHVRNTVVKVEEKTALTGGQHGSA